MIECVYDKQTTSSSKIDLTDVDRRFDVAIVKLYTCILNYQVRIVSQMSESKASQTLQNIVKHHDWKELLTGIKDADAGCQDYIKTLHSAKLHAGFDDQSRQLDRMLQNFKKLTDRLDEKRKNRCIQTFRTSDYEMHKRRVPKRADNTCNWFQSTQVTSNGVTATSMTSCGYRHTRAVASLFYQDISLIKSLLVQG